MQQKKNLIKKARMPEIDWRTGKVRTKTTRYKKAGKKYVPVEVPMKLPSSREYLRQRRHITDKNLEEMKANRLLFGEIKKCNSFIYNATKARPKIKGQLQLKEEEITSLTGYFSSLKEKYARVKNLLRTELVEGIEKALEQFSVHNWVSTNAALMGASRRIKKRNYELSEINSFERQHEAFVQKRLIKRREIDARIIYESNNYLIALKNVLARKKYSRVFLIGVIKRLTNLYNYYSKIAVAPGEKMALKRIENSIKLLVNARDNPNDSKSQKRVWSTTDNLQKIKEDIVNKYAR